MVISSVQIIRMTTSSNSTLIKKSGFALFFVLGFAGLLNAQSVSEIITDYNGYYKSGVGAINSTKPDNNHNLLAFSFNGTRYSTGVNDALLTSHGDAFNVGSFRALPMKNNITGTPTGNTKIGFGALADGVANGAGAAPSRNLGQYLSDGPNGLNLGTVVANLPAGTMFMSVSNLQASQVGDGVPDILVTQVADPSGADYYAFTDINGNIVGNQVAIDLTNIPPVGQWVADFYEATGSTILQPGFTQTQRDMRLWAADFGAFGINASNIANIAYFRIILSGNSDIGFVAYNTTTVSVQQVLSMPGQAVTRPTPARNITEDVAALKLFPNPATIEANLVHPKAKGGETIAVYNNSGLLVKQMMANRNTTQTKMNVAGFTGGTYYVVYNNGINKHTQKLQVF